MSWGPEGFGLPLPLGHVDGGTFAVHVASFVPRLATETRPLVNATNEPAGDVTDYSDADGQVRAKRIEHLDPERETEYLIG